MDKRLLTISLLASIGMLRPTPSQAQGPSALEALRTASGGAAFTVPMAQPAPAFFSSAPPEDSVVSRIRRTMTSRMAPDLQQYMQAHVYVFTVGRDEFLPNAVAATLRERLPRDQSQSEIAFFMDGYVERKKQAGNRTPAEPRGYTGTFSVNGDIEIYCFVGEENLTAAGEWDVNGSRSRRVLVHELGHAVYRSLTQAEKVELRNIAIEYASHATDAADAYHEGDENEMFAVSGEIWFGVHQSALNTKGFDTSAPFVKLAPMMRFIERLYGPARSVR